MMETLEAGARALSIELDNVEEVETPRDIAEVIRSAKDRNAQALYVWPNGFAYSFAQEISEVANANGLTSVHPFKEGALAGGLLAYGADLREQARRGAAYVDKILRGTRSGDLPIEQLSKYELTINLITAKALGVTIPPSLLARADELIE
jgi:putative ABC transport system substrate-binding protein